MLLSRLIWASHKCELHSDESVLQLPEKHVFPPLLQTPGANTCSRLLQEVLSMQLPTAHTKIKGCSDTNSEWALRPNTWKQHPTSNEIREGTKQRELSILLLITWLTAILWLLLMAGLQYYCIELVQITPFILKRVGTSSNQCNESLQVTEGKKLMT